MSDNVVKILLIELIIGKSPVSTNADGLISLTDLWRASGLGNDRKPGQWLRWARAKEFIAEVQRSTQDVKTHLVVVKWGTKTPGTYAHWQIALAYAKYLSPELHMQVNEVFMRYKAGEGR